MLKHLKKLLRMSEDDTQAIDGLTADETATLISLMTKVGIDETVLRDLVAGVSEAADGRQQTADDGEDKSSEISMSLDAINQRLDGFEKRLAAAVAEKREVPKASEKETPKGYFGKLRSGEFCR